MDANNYNTHDLHQICIKIAAISKCPLQRPDPAIVYQSGNSAVAEYPAIKLKCEEIVNINGADDAFVEEFLSQYIQKKKKKSVAESVECGHYNASTTIRQEG
ncbi:pfkB carbohydrate kinase family protein [Acanthocheilonema viteae]